MAAKDIAKSLRQYNLTQVLATVPVRPGSKGFAAIAGKQAEFREDFQRGLEYAVEAGCPLLHPLSGVVDPHCHTDAGRYFDENIRWALEKVEGSGVKIVIESINQIDAPGYFIRSLGDAHRWTRDLDGLGLILDFYHASMELGKTCSFDDLVKIEFDHIQIASYPNRNEPDEKALLALRDTELSAQQFTGWVGCEYVPARHTLDGLKWLSPFVA